ncbi:MAG TPA: hypothetical protein VGP47_03060, partial [Parachlamydiaceae bacterium]|nr:hypothetical protein [Parachlamydiaceae bacterium]
MNVACLSTKHFLFDVPDFSCRPINEWAMEKINVAKRILDKHTDVISSMGILGITTCLLASKIFEATPKFLPRVARLVYNYAGIIWLNVQMRDLQKSIKDASRVGLSLDIPAMVETAAKVFVKGANIILTCVLFAGSVISAVALPEASLAIALSIRSFSLSCLFINVASDVRDYFANEALLKRLEKMEADPDGSLLIGKVMVCFLEIIKNLETPSKVSVEWKEEWSLADKLVRQLDSYTVETFRESLQKDRKEKNPLVDALKLFYGVKDGLMSTQAYTKANLSLT